MRYCFGCYLSIVSFFVSFYTLFILKVLFSHLISSNLSILHSNSLRLATVPPKISPFGFGEEPLNFGEPASVQCTILGGDLPMSVTWLLNNQSVQQIPDISLSKIGKRIHVLTIESVASHHAGEFQCIVKNIAGLSEHSAVLSVNGL